MNACVERTDTVADVVQTWHDPQAIATGTFEHLNAPVGTWDRYHCVTPRPEARCRCGRYTLQWQVEAAG